MTKVDDRDDDGNYWIDDSPYPSVTKITGTHPPAKKAIQQWKERAENPEYVRDRAATLGTIVHRRLLSRYSMRRLPQDNIDVSFLNDEFIADVETCCALWDDVDLEVAEYPHIEETVYSHEYRYAGTLDMLTDGTIVDLKCTSSGIKDTHKMQASAYRQACNELDEMPDVDSAAIVQLDYDNVDWNVVRLSASDLDTHFDRFCELLEAWHSKYS